MTIITKIPQKLPKFLEILEILRQKKDQTPQGILLLKINLTKIVQIPQIVSH